jgi:hypothetical protein
VGAYERIKRKENRSAIQHQVKGYTEVLWPAPSSVELEADLNGGVGRGIRQKPSGIKGTLLTVNYLAYLVRGSNC